MAGICFSMLFIYLELGLLGATLYTATAVTDNLQAEILLTSPRFVHIASAGTIEMGRIYQALGDPDVVQATPLFVRVARWRAVETRKRCNLIGLGVRVNDPWPVDFRGVDGGEWDRMRIPQTMIVHESTDPKCGDTSLGAEPEVRERKVRVVGHHDLGVGFLGDGSLIVSAQTFSELYNRPLNQPELGLIRVVRGANPERVARRLRDLLPGDVRIITKKELNRIQVRHWVMDTSLGIIFTLGTIVGIVIGMAILYQTLSTDILQQLPQYATLKSMGYPDRALNGMVLAQSLIFGLLGLAPATALAYGVYWALRDATNLPIEMTLLRLVLVTSIAAGMSAVSGIMATRKLMLADPADLY